MDAFEAELMRRSPLAAAVLEMFDFILDDATLDAVYSDENRGRCYEDTLTLGTTLSLLRDALVRHGGSAHKLFLELERRQAHPADESNFYRKLARMPVAVTRALLRHGTRRLSELMPERGAGASPLPSCFDELAVVIFDGKKIKNAAKRLKPTRGYRGKLIGAKALVAVDARSGLVLAMSDSLDGEANDVPLDFGELDSTVFDAELRRSELIEVSRAVPALLPQVYEVVPGPALWVADRQFADPATMRRACQGRAGDHFAIRLREKLTFVPEPQHTRTMHDPCGREVIDEIGTLFQGKNAMRLRRVTLRRPGDDDVVVATDLLDRDCFAALDILALYAVRWDIEKVFQQVTETFSLQHLIGCSPKAVLLQFALCLLLYNMMQVVKAYVAEDGGVLASVISMFYLFDDTRRELCAWAYHTDGRWPRLGRNRRQMILRLRELLRGSWDPVAYTKRCDKRPRKKVPKRRLHGGHTSVQRLLEGRVKVL